MLWFELVASKNLLFFYCEVLYFYRSHEDFTFIPSQKNSTAEIVNKETKKENDQKEDGDGDDSSLLKNCKRKFHIIYKGILDVWKPAVATIFVKGM